MESYEDWGDWREKKHRREDVQLFGLLWTAATLGCGVLWMALQLIGWNCEQTAMMLGRM